MFNPNAEFEKYFDEAPDQIALRTPSVAFDPSKTKLKEGYSYVPSQSNPTPVHTFSKTTKRSNPKEGVKAEYDGYSIYKMALESLQCYLQ